VLCECYGVFELYSMFDDGVRCMCALPSQGVQSRTWEMGYAKLRVLYGVWCVGCAVCCMVCGCAVWCVGVLYGVWGVL